MGMHDGKINFPALSKQPQPKGLWLVPKKYSTQNNPAMFVQYIFSL